MKIDGDICIEGGTKGILSEGKSVQFESSNGKVSVKDAEDKSAIISKSLTIEAKNNITVESETIFAISATESVSLISKEGSININHAIDCKENVTISAYGDITTNFIQQMGGDKISLQSTNGSINIGLVL